MAKTRRKDIVRNIRRQLVSWLSIIIISSFAVAAYLGLTYSAHALADAGKALYESTNYHDIQVTSNCLLSKEDLQKIKNLDGINDVEGIFRVNARISTEADTSDILIYSLPEKIDLPVIKEGSLPKEATDCIIEENLAEKLGLKIGDTIEPLDAYNEELVEMAYDTFRLTGIFIHAEHSSFDLDETYCLIVNPEAFDAEQFDNCYTLANITVEKKKYRSLFTPSYFKHVEKYVDEIEILGESLAQKRYDEHLAFLDDQISDSQNELKDAKSQLSFVEKTIPSLNSRTGDFTADFSNMLSVLIYEDPSEYKTAAEQSEDYYDAFTSYENAVKKVDDAKERYKKLTSGGKCIWYVFNRNSSLDFVNLRSNSENLEKLNMSFSLLFVIIAVMVIFASLSRMVHEQRTLIGISKALGLHFREIFSKYFVFGFSASVLGISLGILLSLYIIEGVIAIGYEDHFVFGRFPFMLDIYPTVILIFIAVIISVLAIYFSCRSLMKQSAKKLLSPVVPKGASRELKKSSLLSSLSLYNRMILLNIRSDLGRVIVTIISIAGCCSLIVIGFTLKTSIAGCIARQMSDYIHYDGIIKLNTSLYEDASLGISAVLKEKKVNNLPFLHLHGSIQIDDTMEYSEFLISDNPAGISLFHPLINFETGKPFT